ncbi:hypothetical protein CCS01_31320 [Rhodopila globiformis]|uniref:Tc1-like transposase DDE domain-containing protein n=1 Tax=Rhodopila globiformis TaxID=1071 RepID=A0A2S6MUA1_RHOGL|nr:hypothetical protein CCS01_31320 [Rhodopila globiformis]
MTASLVADHADLPRETMRQYLAENALTPRRHDMWCILYIEAPDPKPSVVCLDKSPTQLISGVRLPIPANSGQPERYDYEYMRNRTVDLFVMRLSHRPWRHVAVTERHMARDYIHCTHDLGDVHYPEAGLIRVVQDALSLHTPGAPYETLSPAKAHRILRRLAFHYTLEHASRRNRVEIETGLLSGQCRDRRISECKRLVAEIGAWEQARNAAGTRINWLFDTQQTREKLGRTYPVAANSHNLGAEVLACKGSLQCPSLSSLSRRSCAILQTWAALATGGRSRVQLPPFAWCMQQPTCRRVGCGSRCRWRRRAEPLSCRTSRSIPGQAISPYPRSCPADWPRAGAP